MKEWSHRLGLRARIILFGLVLVAPLVALILARSDREAEHEFAAARERAQLLVGEANGDFSDLIVKAETVIEVMAVAPVIASDDTLACNTLAESVRSRYAWVNSLFVTDTLGNKLCGTAAEAKPQGILQREWFQRALESKSGVVSDYLVGAVTHKPQIIAARPILDSQGQVIRIVAISIDLAGFNKDLEQGASALGASVLVLDRGGTVLARYPDGEAFLGKRFADQPLVAQAIHDRHGQGEALDPGGTQAFFAFEPFGNTSLTIVAGIAKQPIINEIKLQRDRDLVILLMIVIGCLTIALVGADRLVLKPLRQLGRVVAAIGYGQFDATRELTGGALELDQTVLAVDEMARRLAEREADLKTRESQYRLLADNATDLITLQDTERRPLYVSPACRTMLGYDPAELLCKNVDDLIHPDDAEMVFRTYLALDASSPEALSVYRVRRKDGAYLWIEASIRWIEEAGDEPARILTVVRDVSERKRAEDAASRLQALLSDAIEAMQDGVVLFDSEDRVVLTNSAIRRYAPQNEDLFVPGRRYEEIARLYRASAYADAVEQIIDDSVERHRQGDGAPSEMHLQGAWFSTRHFRTGDGGTLTVITDVTETKHAAAELEAAKDAADRASHAKSAFLASMSHEIRTPMNGVLGFADLLLDSDLSDAQLRQVRGLRDAGKSLLALINDILDISKIEAGKLELERVPTDPKTLVGSTAAILASQIATKGLELRIEQANDIPDWIEGDPTRLRQILLNLVSNALKFTDAGYIAIRSTRERGAAKDQLRFEIEDSGIGIPKGHLHLLFQDFSQVGRQAVRRGGTGLGLAICKRLTEAMGGEIGVTSELGLGSKFWFTIELTESGPPVIATPEFEPTVAPRCARILVAEDVPTNQVVIEALLKRAGHVVTLVDDGLDAVTAVREGDYDLVLMDMDMPEMDGLSATRAIRALGERKRYIPIIALTANATVEDTIDCKSAGMNDFLAKPIDREELLKTVAKWSGGASGDEAPAASTLDRSILDDLEEALGAEQTMRFTATSVDRIMLLAAAMATEADRVQLARDAHNLVAAAGNLGCTELMNCARELSRMIKYGSPDIDVAIANIADAAERARGQLVQRYPSVGAPPVPAVAL